MSDDWDKPADSEFFVIKDNVGALCIFAVNEFLPQFRTKMGTSDTIKAEIVVLDGPNAGKRYGEGLLFGRALVPQLKGKVGGKPVLGRLTQNQADAKPGQSAPYRIADPTDDDKAKASEWVKANGPIVSVPTTSAAPQQQSTAGAGENWRVNPNDVHSAPPNPWGNGGNQQGLPNHGHSYI